MKKFILTILLSFTILTNGSVVFANEKAPQTGDYVALAPLPGTTRPCVESGKTGECADINSYLKGFLNLTIGIGAMLAMIYIAFYGFEYAMSDNPSVKASNKDRLERIIYGFLLIICSYAIIFTINPKLLEFDLNISSPQLEDVTITVDSRGLPGGNPGAFSTPSRAGQPMTQGEIMASNLIKQSLENNGINTYTGPCIRGETAGCVNLNGLLPTTQTGLAQLQKDCSLVNISNCSITITGGTEGGHSVTGSHPKGSGIDLRPTDQLNKFLNIPKPVEGSNKTVIINGRPVKFTYEVTGGNSSGSSTGVHWHLDF